MDKAIAFVKSLGPARIAAMVGVAVFLVGFFALLIMRASEPRMATLYSDLTFEDSTAIVKQLDTQNVPYKLKNDGTAIMVPQDQTLKIRMKLAESGLPLGGSIGYEIFDKNTTLGATNFIQNINHVRALEGELSRSIRTIDRVQSARVHLVLPEKPLFAKDKIEPRASIILKLRSGLDAGQVKAVQNLVASAVPGMKPNNVSMVDERGKLLTASYGDSSAESSMFLEERRLGMERRLRDEVEAVIANVVGQGRARVQVNAEMEMNRITQTQDSYDPETRVVRSSQSRGETSKTAPANSTGEVSNSTELPSAQQPATSNAANAKDETNKNEETVNYEISRTTKTEVSEPGRLKRLSVAVLVDGIYTKGADDQYTYAARPQEEMDKILALVRSSVGFDEARGDKVEVVNLKFADAPNFGELNKAVEKSPFDFTFTKDDIMAGAELIVMFLSALAMILFVVRPMMKRAFGEVVEAPISLASAGLPMSALEMAQQQSQYSGAGAEQMPDVDLSRPENNPTLQAIEVAKIAGQMQAVSLQKVGELVENNPDEAVIILRQWMNEPVKA